MASRFSFICPNTEPHAAHVWEGGDREHECDGVAGKGTRMNEPTSQATSQVVSNSVPTGWVDVFYVESWVDPVALDDPKFAPRKRALNGPFRTYPEAQQYVPSHRPHATHFQVVKQTAQEGMVKWFNPEPPVYATGEIG